LEARRQQELRQINLQYQQAESNLRSEMNRQSQEVREQIKKLKDSERELIQYVEQRLPYNFS